MLMRPVCIFIGDALLPSMISASLVEWCEDYEKNTVNEKELQAEIDGYMQIYDNKMEKVRPPPQALER